MNNTVQSFYEAVVKDAALREQLVTLEKEVAGKSLTEVEREAFIREKLLPVAKAAGFDLTLEELKAYKPVTSELSAEELAEVSAGGNGCICVAVGASRSSGCVLIGFGNIFCFLGGAGER